jgi:hypothetical protein
VGGQFDVLCNNAGVIFDVCVHETQPLRLHLCVIARSTAGAR